MCYQTNWWIRSCLKFSFRWNNFFRRDFQRRLKSQLFTNGVLKCRILSEAERFARFYIRKVCTSCVVWSFNLEDILHFSDISFFAKFFACDNTLQFCMPSEKLTWLNKLKQDLNIYILRTWYISESEKEYIYYMMWKNRRGFIFCKLCQVTVLCVI